AKAEVLGVANQGPAIQKRARSADVVRGVVRVVRDLAEPEDNGVDLPTPEQLGRGVVAWSGPSACNRKAVEGVGGGIAVIGTRIVVVLHGVIGELPIHDVQ